MASTNNIRAPDAEPRRFLDRCNNWQGKVQSGQVLDGNQSPSRDKDTCLFSGNSHFVNKLIAIVITPQFT